MFNRSIKMFKSLSMQMTWSLEKLENIRKNLASSIKNTKLLIERALILPWKYIEILQFIKTLDLNIEDKEKLLNFIYNTSSDVNDIIWLSYNSLEWLINAQEITDKCVIDRPWITESVIKLEEEQERMIEVNLHDDLTLLKSSHYLNDQWKQLFYRSDNFSLTFIDLNNFKIINDTYWHPYWDILLKIFWIYLFEYFDNRKNWTTIRKHWDEFLVLSENEWMVPIILKLKEDIKNWKVLSEFKKIEQFIKWYKFNDSNINDNIDFNISIDEKYNSLLESIFIYYKEDFLNENKLSIENFSIVELLSFIDFSYWNVFKKDMDIKDFDWIINKADKEMYKNKREMKQKQIKDAS